MHKTATVNIRIKPNLKVKAEHILDKIGLTSAEAVRLFYQQICLHQGLPFEVRIPNKQTRKALRDARERKTHKAKSVDELFQDLD